MILVDAGPLVALLHRDDRDHERCAEAFRRVRGPLGTTWPPLTEAAYLLGFAPRAQDALLEMIERGALRLLPLDESDLPRVRGILHKYRDLPMDLADATLVHVAEREGTLRVFTLDRRHFSVYRAGRRAFQIIP